MKSDGELMEILNAYDLTRSYPAAGHAAGPDDRPLARPAGDLGRDAGESRPP